MKIFFNEKYFFLTKSKYAADKDNGSLLVSDDGGLQFDDLIANIENSPSIKRIVITTTNVESTFALLAEHYRIIEAAGGLVKNDADSYLLIYRNDKWDLPKGKIDKGEKIEDAAIREVKEECGISDVRIKSTLPETYHIYHLKGERILKRTYWFNMLSNDVKLLPQKDEGITAIEWTVKEEVLARFAKSYGSIKELIGAAI
jgi:8-oxo-dGTP pyrophosphatase MutT (NUDIX family)